MHQMHTKLSFVTAVLLALCAGVGCDDDQGVTTSRQGKESGAATNPMGGRAGEPGVLAPDAVGRLQWDVPDGWRQDATPRPMREATLQIGEGEKSAELIVTRLAGGFGELGANINRWRGQIGMPAVENAQETPQESITTPVGEAKAIRLEGEKQASIIVMLPDGDTNLFFRLTGERETVLANEPKLKQMLSTIRRRQ